MAGGFIAFRCSNYEHTAEREQFRTLCKHLRRKYYKSEKMCFLIANYNIFDSELDAILIKNDAIIAIELKNYGGNIIAVENGDWTSNGTKISGGSRKSVYQQARVNHASLRNGLNELGINGNWIKDLPSLIVFNKLITLDNRLSNKVQSWLHVTDNAHFVEKIDDITCLSTNLSNAEMVDLAIKLNLNSFIDKDLSSIFSDDKKNTEKPEDVLQNDIIEDIEKEQSNSDSKNIKDVEVNKDALTDYDRFTPNHIFNLRPNQIFVFGTDRKGSQKYGAAGIAANKFGAQAGITEGPTGSCYALPTKGFMLADLTAAVKKLIQYIDENTRYTYLITPVGCGHAGFNAAEVAVLFKNLVKYKNVMLPKLFIDVLITADSNKEIGDNIDNSQDDIESYTKNTLVKLKKHLRQNNKSFNETGSFILNDDNGNVIAQAEVGLYDEKIVFSPFNIQSSMVFRNNGYIITTPEEYLSKSK